VQVSAYGIATAVQSIPVHRPNHYLSDVLVGSALGYGSVAMFTVAHHRPTAGSSDDEGIPAALATVALSRSGVQPARTRVWSYARVGF